MKKIKPAEVKKQILKVFKKDLKDHESIEYTRIIKRNMPFKPREVLEIVIEVRLWNKKRKRRITKKPFAI